MGEWKKYRLGDLCTKIGSGATPKGGKSAYQGGEFALVRSQNVLDFYFSKDGLAYINSSQAEELRNVEIKEGDVLLNITGDSVARVCKIPNSILPARVNQHVAIIRADSTKTINDFILYYLQYKKRHLLSLAGGGATRNALTKGMIENFSINLPSLEEQRKIAEMLSEIDEKIAINCRICENLEAQAQALFKHWFIDFAPFKDGKFVESELGMIPEGWRVGKLGEICTTNRRTLSSRNTPNIIKYLDTGNITANKIDNIQILYKGQDIIPSRAKRLVSEGDIIFSSVRPNQRHYGLLMNPSPSLVVSTGFVVITANWSGFRYFIYQFLIQNSIIETLQAIAEQSVSTYPSINANDIESLKIVIPRTEDVETFANICCNFYSKIESIEQESHCLATLRDTLLPRLMSGELKVN